MSINISAYPGFYMKLLNCLMFPSYDNNNDVKNEMLLNNLTV